MENSIFSPEWERADKLITIGELLQQCANELDRVDARWILKNMLKVDTAFLITHSNDVLGGDQIARFRELVARRITGEPVAYLTGERGFYDLVFEVTPDVLIPRPETELLVETALSKIPSGKRCHVLDLGTGSGVVAITIAKHRPETRVMAVDLSPRALAVAQKNAITLSVGNVTFVVTDWYSGLSNNIFYMIVANPPYVAERDPHLEEGDLRFEPSVALVAKENGMECIRRIIMQAPDHLERSGWLLFEHGYDQADACRKLLGNAGFAHIFTRPDLAGVDRISGGQYGFISV